MEQESVVAGELLLGGLAKGGTLNAHEETMSFVRTDEDDERLTPGNRQIMVSIKTPTKRRLAGNDDSREFTVTPSTTGMESGDDRNAPDRNGVLVPEEPSSPATACESKHSMATPPKKGRIAAAGGRTKVQQGRPLVVEDETGARFVVPAEPPTTPMNTDGCVLRSVENHCPGTPDHNLKSPISARAAGASEAHDGEGTAEGRQHQGSARRRGRPRKNRLPAGDETPGNGRAASEPLRNSKTDQTRETSRGRTPAGERGGRSRHSDGLFNGSDADDDSDDEPRFLTPIRPQESRKRRSSNHAGSDENGGRSNTPGRQPLYMVPHFSRDVVPVEKMKQLNATIDAFLRRLDDDDVPFFQPSSWVLEKGDLTVQGVSFQELKRRMKAEKSSHNIRQPVPKSLVSQNGSVGDVDEQLSENIGIMSVSTDMVGGGTRKEGDDADEVTNISLFDVTPDGIICGEENDPAESSAGKEN